MQQTGCVRQPATGTAAIPFQTNFPLRRQIPRLDWRDERGSAPASHHLPCTPEGVGADQTSDLLRGAGSGQVQLCE